MFYLMAWIRAHGRRIAFWLLATGFAVCVLFVGAALSSPAGRYCDDRIGALGHPYWLFSAGRVDLVMCGQHQRHGTYQRTQNGWVWINDFGGERLGIATNCLELHWWGLTVVERPKQESLRRCWHFWMNSHGPLWHAWDK
jgi:hypothetical protein